MVRRYKFMETIQYIHFDQSKITLVSIFNSFSHVFSNSSLDLSTSLHSDMHNKHILFPFLYEWALPIIFQLSVNCLFLDFSSHIKLLKSLDYWDWDFGWSGSFQRSSFNSVSGISCIYILFKFLFLLFLNFNMHLL